MTITSKIAMPLKRLFAHHGTAMLSGAPRFIANGVVQDNVPEWSDDAPLRQLASDSASGKTDWVLAADMHDFLAALDAYNSARAPDTQVRVSISAKQVAAITAASNAGYPDCGPQILTERDMRFICGDAVVPASYSASPTFVNVNIHTRNGNRVVDFGGNDPFHQAFAITALPQFVCEP